MSPIREHLFTSWFYCSLLRKNPRNFYSNLILYNLQKFIQQPLTFFGWAKKFTQATIYDGEILPNLQYKYYCRLG